MPEFLPYGRQSLDDDDIAAVRRVMESDFLTTGPEVEAFESDFANRLDGPHAVALSSGTAALHLALRAAGIGPGDRVLTSPITFLASANAAAYVGATPDFADIDPVTGNLSPEALEAAWQDDVRAVVAVHYAGHPCDMEAIAGIARRRGAIVIEDACHAVGGFLRAGDKDWPIGHHPWTDLAAFSFHPVKTITTGEGGMLVTASQEYADTARRLRSHAMIRDPGKFTGLDLDSEPGPWSYEMQELGYNYRLTDLQCALGRSQLRKLDRFIARRQEIIDCYNNEFAGIEWLQTPQRQPHAAPGRTSWHLYTVQIEFDQLGVTRAEVMNQLRSAGIGSQVLYIPVYLQPWYRRTYGYTTGKCPAAEAFYERVLSLPLYPALTDDDLARVIDAVLALAS